MQIVAGMLGLGLGILSLVWTFIAFTGGTMPLIGIETEGSFGFGLLWLLVLEPIVIGIIIAGFSAVAGAGAAATSGLRGRDN